ncbi:MAG TPA: tetratricopeptide repeat protein [Polyangiaceae bacterium]|nr:tetratricopeptide repeat protein [Polyangiaceae bacterium]
MSVVDLHPEDLLDKAVHGALTDAERARLDAHVATCAVCRFELMARDDFAALAEPRARAPRVEAPLAPPAPELVARGAGRSRRRGLVVGLAAALVGGMSFAALSAGLVPFPREKPAPNAERATAVVSARAAAVRAVDAPAPPAPSSGDEPVRADAPSVNTRLEKERTSPRARGHGVPAAAELFSAANGARRSHDVERAISLYRELESRYPQSEEARVSYATLATLLLDRGDARDALDGFDRYLSRGGSALGEEALVGRALAFQKLGAEDNELAAWREVLRRFPGSVHAAVARARLAALGQR